MLVQDAVNQARNLVYGSLTEQINLLEQPYASGDTTLTMELDTAQIKQGMILSADLNEWWVKDVDHGQRKVHVVPNWNGSRSGSIRPGTVVRIRPRVTDWALFNEVNRTIVSMGSRQKGLYQEGLWLARSNGSFHEWGVFDFLTDATSVIGVRVQEPWGRAVHTLQDRDWRWMPDRGEIKVLNREYGWVQEIEVMYRRSFRPASSLSDDLETVCGLSESMQDIPALGAAANLLLSTEGRRGQVTTQGDPRRQEEVSPGSNSSAAREMRRRFDDRCNDEYASLLNANPLRMSI